MIEQRFRQVAANSCGHPAVDPRTGIVNRIVFLGNEPDDPRVFITMANVARLGRIYERSCSDQSSGAGLDRKTAILSAVGEAVERYCSAIYDLDQTTLASYHELHAPAVHPEAFAFYHERQYSQADFPWQRFTEDTVVRWTWAYSLTSNRPMLVPATSVYFPYFAGEGEASIWDQITTGLSCAPTLDEAVLKGIYEVVERDAVSMMWLNKLSFPRIDLASCVNLTRLYHDHFEIPGCNYYLVNITNDIPIPTTFGVMIDERGGALTSAATRLDAGEAVAKTLLELSQTRIAYKRFLVQKHPKEYLPDFSNVNDFIDHSLVYTDRNMRSMLSFTYASDRTQTVAEASYPERGSVADDLRTCLSILHDMGYQVLVADVTTLDAAACGHHVVRVIIPGLVEMTSDHRYPRVGGRRLYDVPWRLGLLPAPNTHDTLNRDPHPFP